MQILPKNTNNETIRNEATSREKKPKNSIKQTHADIKLEVRLWLVVEHLGGGCFLTLVGVALINSLILINEPQSQIHENAIQRQMK